MKGIYVSYNERVSDPFDEAVKMSNDEYVIWKDNRSLNHKFTYPAEIIIKISGKEKYYIGDLLLVRQYSDFNKDLFKNDISHRPTAWRKDIKTVKWVFFIANLNSVSKPKEVKNKPTPEGRKEIICF